MAGCVHGHRHGRLVHAGQVVGGGWIQLHMKSKHWQQGAEQQKNHQHEKNGGERRHVELAAQDAGVAREFHLPFSVTMLTISAAARSMSSTTLFTRLTR